MELPSNRDFAAEVKTDRLVTLWRVTLAGAIILVWILLSIAMMQRTEVSLWVVALGVIIAGCLLCRWLIKRSQFVTAVWAYSLGALLGITISITSTNETIVQIVPFTFPVVIFVVGLLLPPSTTFVMAFLAAAATLFVPTIAFGSLSEYLG